MSVNVKAQIDPRPISFYSANISPQNHELNPFLEQELNNDPIYFMASQIKKKIVHSFKKSKRPVDKNNSCFVKYQQKQQVQRNPQQTDISLNTKQIIPSSPAARNKFYRPMNSHTIENHQESKKILLDQERKLLSKITIHRIRSQRNNIEDETKKMQNNYNYLLHKIQLNKKRQQQIKNKKIKQQKLQEQKRKELHQLCYAKSIFIQEQELQKSRIRQSVLRQKVKKQNSLVKLFANRTMKAGEARQEAEKLKQQILIKELWQLQNKRIKYTLQKDNQRQRILRRQQSLQNRRILAQGQFKKKWLNQFNKNTKARKNYFGKKQILSRKMQNLLQDLREKDEKCDWSQKKEKSKVKIKSRINSSVQLLN